MRNKSIRAIAAAAALVSLGFTAQSASALPVHVTPIVIDISGVTVESFDSSATAATANYKFNVGTNQSITALSFENVSVTTDTPDPRGVNWASYLRIEIYNSAGLELDDNFSNETVGSDATYDQSGTVTFANVYLDFASLGVTFNTMPDGLLYVKFYEDPFNYYQQINGAQYATAGGATIDSGTVTITAVPESSNVALMMLGLAGMGLVAARRRSKN